MNIVGESDLSLYTEIKPLCGKEHIVLVQDKENKRFVKKTFNCCDIEVYRELAGLKTDGIPKIEGIYLTENRAVIVEEYIEGMTIEERMLKNGVFSKNVTVDIIEQLCEILKELHTHKPAVIHRDIKPSNVILTPENKVVLIDFNGAKLEKSYETQDTVLMGTVGYAAPEQYGFGSSTPQTDIYGIGTLMNYMLTGQLPTDKLYNKSLKAVIKRCVQLNPKDRFQSVASLLKELKHYNSHYVPYFPPGFRSMNVFKMIVAGLGYATIMYFFKTDEENAWTYRIWMCGIIVTILFYGNYLNMRVHFPFMRSESRIVRIIGYIINPFIIMGFFLLSLSLIQVLFFE